MRRFLRLIMLAVALLAFSLPAQAQSMPEAIAELYDTDGTKVGMVELRSVEDGVQVLTRVKGFGTAVTSGQRGEHGFHIHEAGDCSASDFTSAGGHFNPTRTDHGLLDPDGAHAGDLPNLWIEADGSADYMLTTDLISLKPSERYVFDSDGSAFIIHAGPDDYHTDPSGDSGSRLACGVIEPL